MDSNAAKETLHAYLHQKKLRPTRERMLLLEEIMRTDGHFDADQLYASLSAKGLKASRATVYNTLRQFTEAGLLRELAVDGSRTYFDTNTSNHSHFFIEREGRLVDIPGDGIRVDGLPQPPEGMAISHIDVVVRLVKK